MVNKRLYLRIFWSKFKNNRAGFYSLLIFAVLFALSMGAELVANDRPLLVRYKGETLFPAFNDYPEIRFGGQMESTADYHDPVVCKLIEDHGWMLWPPIRYSYNTLKRDSAGSFPSPPDSENLLGTDGGGKDIAAIILYGFRVSLLFGLLLTAASMGIGIIAGSIMGYKGGMTDLIGQRAMEIWGGFPVGYLIMILSSLIMPSFFTLLGIMLLFSWMGQAAMVRIEFLKGRKLPYAMAAKALGVPDRIIIFRHILPNALVSTFTFLPFTLAGSITALTSLDFLGFGLSSDYPALGELLLQGKNNLYAPWIGISAFGFLALILTLLLFIGEAARDAFDGGNIHLEGAEKAQAEVPEHGANRYPRL